MNPPAHFRLFTFFVIGILSIDLRAQVGRPDAADEFMLSAMDRYNQNLFTEALALVDSAFVYSRRRNEAPAPHFYANRGAILFSMGNYAEALRQFRTGLFAAEKLNDRWAEAVLYANLGNTYQKTKKYSDAYLALMKAADWYEQQDAKQEYAAVLYQLSDCYLEAGQWQEARRYAELLNASAGPAEQLYALLAQGKIALHRREYLQAAPVLRQAQALANRSGTADWSRYTTLLLMQCYVNYEEQRRQKPALPPLFTPEEERILLINTGAPESYPDPKQRLTVYRVTSRLQENRGNFGAAIDNLNKFIALNDSILGVEQMEKINHLETEYKTRDKQRQIDLLESEKLVSALTLRQRTQDLTLAQLEADRRAKLVRLLEQQRELDTCALQNANIALEFAEVSNRRKNSEIELLSRDNALHQAAISRQRLWIALLLTLSALAGLTGWLFYRRLQERRIDALRNRLSRDLHDDLGSALSSIALNGAIAAQTAEPEKMRQVLNRISDEARLVSTRVRDLVWTLHPNANNMEETLARMRQFAVDLLEANGVDVRFDIGADAAEARLGLDALRHFYLFFKEVLHNTARHAGAKQVDIRVRSDKKRLHLDIRDNGCGFDPATVIRGNGLNNLAARAELLRGKWMMETLPGKGTSIGLVFPLK